MTEQDNEYPREPKLDKEGRIVDPGTGRVLRDRRSRTFGNAPFKGKTGKPHPHANRLKARIAVFESDRIKTSGRHKPGSMNK